ncbi:MAG: polysaccharide deacetylase family protein, partial [Promethearchaeota archaeon]
TLFVIAGSVGGTNKKWKLGDHPERRLIGWREIEEMKGYGITIGSHSITHPFLTRLSYGDAVEEIGSSKKILEDKTGAPVDSFAYPYGDMNEDIIDIVEKSGYKTACTVQPGFNTDKDNMLMLKRVDIYGTDTLWQFAAKLAFGVNDGTLVIPAKNYLKNAVKKYWNSHSI